MEEKLTKILEKEPSAYIWDNDLTFDITLDGKLDLVTSLRVYKCPSCDEAIIKNNENVLKMISKGVKGSFITCKKCKTEYFLHLPVSDDSSKGTSNNNPFT